MKLVLLVAAVLLAVNASTINNRWEEQWQSFKNEHRRTYKNYKDEITRKQVFIENLLEIEEHNKKYDIGLVTYKVGVSQFADLTKEEFMEIVAPMPPLERSSEHSNVTLFVPPVDLVLEDSIDWREKGAVTEVKDQNLHGCGSCWAFSATGSLEGALFRKTGRLPVISEQNLIDCAHQCSGCKNGYPRKALEYVMENGGIDSEISYPYEGQNRQCRYNAENSVGTIKDILHVKRNSEYDLQAAIATVGPISVSINATGLHHYPIGIYDNPNCGNMTHNHAALVVGYGSENGKDYYIVKNSWGKHWGEDGYIRMARNKNNQCAIASHGVVPVA